MYKKTKLACFFGIFMQAVIGNILPILFIPLKELYGLEFVHLGILIAINFTSQVAADIVFSGLIDKIGYRPLAVGASICALFGLLLLTLTPQLFGGNILAGLIIATFVFAFSGGLLEVIISPITDSITEESSEKGSAMAFMHSFYAWGQVVLIVVTTLFVFFFGGSNWQWICGFWTLVPIVPLLLFSVVPLKKTLTKEQKTKTKHVAFSSFFLVCIAAILFGGGAEVAMSQWSSSFAEKGLLLPKLWGDLLGMTMFALTMGLGRLLFGIFGKKFSITKTLIVLSASTVVCYLLVALSPFEWLSLAACGICGLACSLLWPGTISVASQKFPFAGGWMFAILAAAGDIGAALFPALTGVVVDGVQANAFFVQMAANLGLTMEQFGLRAGILFCTVCPLAALLSHIFLHRKLNQKQIEQKTENTQIDKN